MATEATDDPNFHLVDWEAGLAQERRRRDEAQRRRDAEWREEARTRRRFKDGPPTAPSYVSVPVPSAGPGEPLFRLVPQG